MRRPWAACVVRLGAFSLSACSLLPASVSDSGPAAPAVAVRSASPTGTLTKAESVQPVRIVNRTKAPSWASAPRTAAMPTVPPACMSSNSTRIRPPRTRSSVSPTGPPVRGLPHRNRRAACGGHRECHGAGQRHGSFRQEGQHRQRHSVYAVQVPRQFALGKHPAVGCRKSAGLPGSRAAAGVLRAEAGRPTSPAPCSELPSVAASADFRQRRYFATHFPVSACVLS